MTIENLREFAGSQETERQADAPRGLARRLAARASAEFAQEERAGLVLAAKVRFGILSVIFVWSAIDTPFTGLAYAYDLGVIAVFILLGAAHLLCARNAIWLPYSVYALFALDIAFLGVESLGTNPFVVYPDFPATVLFQLPSFIWFFIFLMQAAFALSPRLVIWCGLCILLARLGQLAVVWDEGQFYTEAAFPAGDLERWLQALFDPAFLSIEARAIEGLFTLSMTAGLAVIAWRSRGLVLRRVVTERERANLARYFSPNVVDTVTTAREELDHVRIADVAVMFVDIKGFTRLCEHLSPDDIAELLRTYYRRLSEVVFAHQGTLDKFIGDGAMVTFGTPTPRPDAAAQALECGFAIIDGLARWNAERRAQGQPPISVSVGLHYGPALIGNIGDERRLEYAVVGDTVNVASRVEGLTRQLETTLAVTNDCVAAVQALPSPPARLLNQLSECGEHSVKGRAQPVRLWRALD